MQVGPIRAWRSVLQGRCRAFTVIAFDTIVLDSTWHCVQGALQLQFWKTSMMYYVSGNLYCFLPLVPLLCSAKKQTRCRLLLTLLPGEALKSPAIPGPSVWWCSRVSKAFSLFLVLLFSMWYSHTPTMYAWICSHNQPRNGLTQISATSYFGKHKYTFNSWETNTHSHSSTN